MTKRKPFWKLSTQQSPPNQDDPGNRQHVRETLLTAVDTQIRDNAPPETRLTFERLVREGQSEDDARRLIARVLVTEMNTLVQAQELYSEERYIAALQRLPQRPGTSS
ncbi:hypothetical protein [Pseudanabaena sp. FACHB-2040]|uniref:hypothetical protein n=1 Tax=Pseudanabaena sp. FACHB-2040 TaxID=2692859 RepID=UPI0016896A0A|nr:hypothetical protein [Pseudanabaena sp. FACHB-2040]MBD2258156.1 hypothetical protein [Pseudanabaena sp. FACHB-2040]